MKSIEIWNKGWEKLYAYIASFCAFVSCKWKIFSVLFLLLILLFLPVDNSYAQYNIEITPVSKTWVYDGTEHGQDYVVSVKVEGYGTYELKAEQDEDGNWHSPSQILGSAKYERWPSYEVLFLRYTYTGKTLHLDVSTRITDVGEKNVDFALSVEEGTFYEHRGILSGYVYWRESVSTRILNDTVVVRHPATYTVTPRPLTINCIGAKTHDGTPLVSPVSGNRNDRTGFTKNQINNYLTYQYDGLANNEYVAAGEFTTESGDEGMYTYSNGTSGSPASVITTPFRINKKNGSNSTSNYNIVLNAQQKIANQEGLVSRIDSITHLTCLDGNDGIVYMEIKNYDSNYKYYYKIDNGQQKFSADADMSKAYLDITNQKNVPFEISGLTKGSHTIVVTKEKNGNVVSDGRDTYTVTIIEPSPLSITCANYAFLSTSSEGATVSFSLPTVMNGKADEWILNNGLIVSGTNITGTLPLGENEVIITAKRCAEEVSCQTKVTVIKQVEACNAQR